MARSPRDRGTGSVRKLPSGRWQARVLVNGRHVSLGSYAQKADANAALRDALGQQDAGRWVDPREGRVSFGTYADEWIAGRHDLAMRTRNDYEDLLRLHLKPAFGATPLADISVLIVRRWWSRASGPDGHGRAPKTYRLLRGILNTAVEDGLIARNPCRIKGAGADNTPERPTVTVEQVYAIAGAISPRYRALVLLAAFTGLRFGELRALRRKRLVLETATLTVAPEDGNVQRDRSGAAQFTRPKSRAGARSVAIPAPIVEEMRVHLALVGDHDREALVFPADKSADGMRPFHAEAFGRQWRKALATVDGLPAGVVFHDLRHTGNTLAAGTGASTRELMARMGHASPRAALIYQHASAERDRAIAEALGAQIARTQERRTDAAS
jgi:integrase